MLVMQTSVRVYGQAVGLQRLGEHDKQPAVHGGAQRTPTTPHAPSCRNASYHVYACVTLALQMFNMMDVDKVRPASSSSSGSGFCSIAYPLARLLRKAVTT